MTNSETRNCQNCKSQFTIEPEDFNFYGRLDMPAPDLCPYCRWKHLLAFWVFGRFRKTTSALSGKTIITTFPESIKFPLYSRDEFVSDAWDPITYGIDYDSSKTFFNQFQELQTRVPHPHQSSTKNVNCEWSDDVGNSRECYLCRSLLDCEFVSYGYRMFSCKNSIDITYSFETELSYDCLYCFKCYKLHYSFNCHNCLDSKFLYDCRNCTNCFMCWNLRNKQYCILNKQYTKEEYLDKLKEFDTDSWDGVQRLKTEFDRIVKEEAVHRTNFNFQEINSSGNFLNESKNCYNSYFIDKSDNVRHSFRGFEYKDVIDSVGSIAEKTALSVDDWSVYETMATLHSSSCRYSSYLDCCEECEYCFGCVGLRKKKYCILNKQYSEKEYFDAVEKIKANMRKGGEWGRFFPLKLAYSGYNFSIANVFFPETKENIEAINGLWEEPEVILHGGAINGDDLPNKISDAPDAILGQRIICPKTKLSFNINSRELAFYREHGIPLPRYHFDYRTLYRFKPMSLMIYLQKGNCCFCKKGITHYYPPELGYQKIACIECYQSKIS